MPPLLRPAVLLVAASLLPGNIRGAVFARIRSTPSAAMEALGGFPVGDATRVELNGGDGTLRTYAFDRPAGAVLDAVNAELRRINPSSGNETGFWIDWNRRTGHRPGGLSVLLIVPCGAPGADQCLAFAIESSSPGDPRWPWGDLAPQPGFETGFAARLDGGRAGFAGGRTDLPPDVARDRWNAHLAEAGWIAASPAAPQTSLALYAKGGETLALLVMEDPSGNGSRVAVLRRAPR